MNSKLTPTVITDKNGKTTTVYRKDNTTTKTNRAIPAPATKTTDTKTPIKLMVDALYPTANKPRKALREILNTYPTDLINKMTPFSPKDPTWIAAASLMADNAPTELINETLYYYPHMGRTNEGFSQGHLKSLRHYPQLPVTNDYSTADDHTRQQCIALLIAVEQLDEAAYNFANDAFDDDNDDYEPIIPIRVRNNAAYIDSPELVDFIMEQPARVQQIIDTIIERKTADTGTLRDVLTDTAPAIAKGNL